MTEETTHLASRPLCVMRASPWLPWTGAGVGGLAIALLSVVLFGVSGRDDPYITFSAAEAIRDSGALVNINGDPIEQSTTLLFTLLLAALSWLAPVGTPVLGWTLSLTALVGVVLTSFALLRHSLNPTRAVAGSWVVGATPPLVYWATSGAEQTLGITLVLLAVLSMSTQASVRHPASRVLLSSVFTLLTYLARPDLGLAVIGAFALLLTGRFLVGRRAGQVTLLVTIVTQVTLVGIITVARLVMTGSALPQPLSAKVGGNVIEQALRGLEYVGNNMLAWWFLAILAVGVWAAWRIRSRAWTSAQVLLLLISLVLIAGMVASGGDWMELGRFFAAPATLITLLALSLLGSIPGRGWPMAVAVIMALQGATLIVWALSPATYESRGSTVLSRWSLNTTGSPGVPQALNTVFNRWNADHLGDAYFLGAAIPAVSDVLDHNPGRTLTVTSGQGGMIPYYLRHEFGSHIRFIDRFQLMTDDFDDCGLQPGPYGAFISWNQWEDLAGQCAPSLPDLAFSIGPIPYDDLGDDYEVLVHVEGTAERGGQSLPQEQWLAARKDLLHRS